MTREETSQYIKSELANEDAEIYLDVDDYKVIIEALEQEPCEDEDIMTIHTQGLDEGIRCAMCTNSMKSDRSCDGGCVINEAMYKEVMNTIRNHIVPPITPTHKKGKWINRSSTSGCGIRFVASECSCCNKKTFFDCDQLVYKYCPNCGAEMEVEE